MHPSNVPIKFRIEHDQTSSKLARQTTDKVRIIAKDLGIGELVDVDRILVESVPESAFLGRWQAFTRGEVQIIDIQPNGVCVFAMSPGAKLVRGEMSLPGKWFLTPQKIFMDIKDQLKLIVYRGQINKKGHLVVDRGEIHTEGRFGALTDRHPTVFKKMY